MKIDFNNARKKAVDDYSVLVKLLNSAIDETGNINIYPDDLDEVMRNLRTGLVAIACSYLPDNPDIRDLSEEIQEIPYFNEDDED